MRLAKRFLRHAVPLGFLVLIWLGGLGCHLIAPYDTVSPSKTYWQCYVPEQNCEKVLKDISLTVSSPSSQGECYIDGIGTGRDQLSDPNDPEVVPGFSVSDSVYCQKNWVIQGVGQDKLKGGHWILTRETDNDYAGEEFLVFDIDPGDPPADVYVAYDGRAITPPKWLQSPPYEAVDGSITITRPGQGKTGLELNLWRTQTPVSIPGNLYGNPDFSNLNPGEEPVMYTVIVKPHILTNCKPGAPADREFMRTDPCGEDESTAKADALEVCERNKESGSTCGEPICQMVSTCVDTDAVEKEMGLSVVPWVFVRHSEIAFDNSKARVVIAGEAIDPSPKVNGTLHFEFKQNDSGALREMQINSMILHMDPFDTRAGRVEDTVLALLAPVTAVCTDPYPPWTTPCTTYEIAQGEMTVSEFTRIGDNKLLTVTQNVSTQPISVDHTNRGFQIHLGPWPTSVFANGNEIPIEIEADLSGRFVNFAPMAVAIESTRSVECAFDKPKVDPELQPVPGSVEPFSSNASPIYLNAAGSFEVYKDPIPDNAHQWYEDYGLVTERHLGTGPKVIIPPHHLSFGVHSITLAIRDDHGVADFDTFELDVRDTMQPDLFIPSDVFVIAERNLPVRVDIGKAEAIDICSNQIDITHNASRDLLFPPGEITRIVWSADDGRGHVTTDVQRVYVFHVSALTVDTRRLEKALGFLAEAANKTSRKIADCLPTSPCIVEPANLVNGVEALIQVLEHHQPPPNGESTRSGTIDTLRQLKGQLLESKKLLEQSNSGIRTAVQLRTKAAESMYSSSGVLKRSQQLMQQTEPVYSAPAKGK